MSEKQRCCKRVYVSGGAFTGHNCTKPARVEINGVWYCSTHDPAKVKERNEKSAAKWSAEWAEKKKVMRLQLAAPDLLQALEKARDFIRIIDAEGYASDDNLLYQVDAAIAKAKGEA